MNAVIVYYSLEGNTEYVVKQLQKEMNADVCKLEPVKAYPTGKVSKFFWGGKSVVFGEKPKLLPYQFDEAAYDTVIIATPIWASSYVPPIKAFLDEHKLENKQVGIVACSTGGNVEKCFNKLKSELKNCKIKDVLSLIDPAVHKKQEDTEKIKAFAKKMMAQ